MRNLRMRVVVFWLLLQVPSWYGSIYPNHSLISLDKNADRCGRVKVDEEQRPMNYSQAFQLLPDGAGSYFVFNDIFRLIYG